MADRLTRETVLYDRWHAAEFNRLNLATYLSALYHDDADLIAVFLCKEYKEKQWCGLEWRACLDLIKTQSDVRMMFFRLDDAEIPGLYSIDGYQNINSMTDVEVASAIFSQLRAPTAVATYRTFTSKLPIVNPTLIGRDNELAFLDRAWADPATNFVQIIAAGGTGKTALVDKWFRRHLGEATVFGWSFYSQGSSPDRQTSSDPFFNEILTWFDIKIAPTASVYAKAEAVARRLREERVLLLLDGVEPLQDATGALRYSALKALLQELETANRGLVVCTTRARIDIPDDAPRVLSIDLDNLTAEQGAEYLRHLKVEGTDEELRQASSEHWNHALALTLLGTYLVDFCDGDIRRRIEIPRLSGENAHAQHVIAAYERMFAGKPEVDILRALGYFDRPAEPAALKLVLPATSAHAYRAALNRLFKARLILTTDPARPLDCHPLVREHFAASATAEGHGRLYEHYKKQAPEQPDTLEEMTPLFYAVYHGCRAGRHQDALDEVLSGRIRRGDEYYLIEHLGAWGTDLSLLANFFQSPWIAPTHSLCLDARSWVISQAAFALRALGRTNDAIEPMLLSAEAAVKRPDWENAALYYSELRGLHLTLGDVSEAISNGRHAVQFAYRAGDVSRKTDALTALAVALEVSGALDECHSLFQEAERLQAEGEPDHPMLYGVRGYRYCNLLLGEGKYDEVIRRSNYSLLAVTDRQHRAVNAGLDHLSLGRALPSGSPESQKHFIEAIERIRRSGRVEDLARALLARGTPHDLEEVFKIATRSGMRLFLADYHLAKGNVAEAEKLINETGYHRRDKELAALKASTRP